jgi:hypothetical protein
MEDFQISYIGVIRANQIKLKLSSKLLDINKDLIQKEEKDLLRSVNCTNTKEYFSEIKKICGDR